MMKEPNSRFGLIRDRAFLFFAIFLAAGTMLRLVAAFSGGSAPHYEYPVAMDEVNYLELSSNIVEFGTYGSWSESFFTRSTRSPLYPAVLAATRIFTDQTALAAHILNFVLDTVNILLVWRLGLMLFGRNAAALAGAIYSVFGPGIFYMHFITSDTLSVLIFLVLCISVASARSSYFRSLAAAVPAAALFIHVKPAFLAALPFLCIALYLCQKDSAKASLRAAKAIIPALLVLLLCIPWTLRNYRIHKSFVPVCTVAGWHLYDNVLAKEDLNPKRLMEFIYSPARSSFTETDYYNEGMDIIRDKFLGNPLKAPACGMIRLAVFWMPQEPYFRIFLPHAYMMPLKLGNSFLVPLPDFEGCIYASIIAIIVSLFLLGMKKFRERLATWISESREVALLIVGYVLAYSLGFPMIQYRFVAEPAMIALASGLACILFSGNHGKAFEGNPLRLPYATISVLLCLVAVAAIFRREPQPFEYPGRERGAGWDFESLHRFQRMNGGNLPNSVEICEAGVVRYIGRDLEFSEGGNTAARRKGSAVGKLYAGLYDSARPLGKGDLKLNFSGREIPAEGDKIMIRGRAICGLYREIIVNVEKWEKVGR